MSRIFFFNFYCSMFYFIFSFTLSIKFKFSTYFRYYVNIITSRKYYHINNPSSANSHCTQRRLVWSPNINHSTYVVSCLRLYILQSLESKVLQTVPAFIRLTTKFYNNYSTSTTLLTSSTVKCCYSRPINKQHTKVKSENTSTTDLLLSLIYGLLTD